MIDVALSHTEKLDELFRKTWFNDKYIFYNYLSWNERYAPSNTTYNRHEFVSLNVYNDVIGYISYYIDRQAYFCYGLSIINFSSVMDKSSDLDDFEIMQIFSQDVITCLRNIFDKFKFNKITFDVAIGNPAEKHYDRLIKRVGGRIVGVYKNDIFINGEFYDKKLYELTRDEYMKFKNKKMQGVAIGFDAKNVHSLSN